MSGRHRQSARARVSVVPEITGVTVVGGNAHRRTDGIWEVQYGANATDVLTLQATVTNRDAAPWFGWFYNNQPASVGHLTLDIPRNQIDPPDASFVYTFAISTDGRSYRSVNIAFRRVPVLQNALALSGFFLVDEGGGDHRSYPVGQGRSITVTATTVPATPAAYQHLAWVNAGNPTPIGNQRAIALDAAGLFAIQARIGQSQATAVRRLTIVGDHDNPLGLRADYLTFAGGRPVVRDDPNHIGLFDRQWRRDRVADPVGQSPQWYTKHDRVTLAESRFDVTAVRAAHRRVRVRATAFFRHGVAQAYVSWPIWDLVVRSDYAWIRLDAADSGQLPDEVVNADPFEILWEASVDGGAWSWFDTTSLTVYATFADPRANYVLNGFWDARLGRWVTATRPTVGFYTLLAISCRAAEGVANAADLVARIYHPFTQVNAITGVNDQFRRKLFAGPGPLAYWKPYDTSSFDMWVVFAGQSNSARCGAWSEMFVAMGALHGAELQVTSAVANGAVPGGAAGFLVRNWRFFAPPAENGAAYTHIGSPRQRGECYPGNRTGVVGQNNENPPPVFGDHAVVIDPDNARIYDPSYGGLYANKTDWFYASIGGLFRNTLNPDHPNCGYSTTALVRALPNIITMVNQVTGLVVN